MPNFRRIYIPNSMVFITSTTYRRNPYLEKTGAEILMEVVNHAKTLYTFSIIAHVILPDHFHWIIETQDEAGDFSAIMKSVKWNFAREYKKAYGISSPMKIWQDRFWDHVIRDENDLSNHIEYIHWNPVKHGYIRECMGWKFSSIHQFIEVGFYESDKRGKEIPKTVIDTNWE